MNLASHQGLRSRRPSRQTALTKPAARIHRDSTFGEVETYAKELFASQKYVKLIELCLKGWVVPVQLPLTARGLPLEVVIQYVFRTLHRKDLGGLCSVDYAGDDRLIYPLKDHIGAQTKVNMFYRDVHADVQKFYPDALKFWVANNSVTKGLSNDAATAWLCWVVVALRLLPEAVVRTVLAHCQDVTKLKMLNETIKGLGLASTVGGATLCELTVLLGRMTGSVTAEEDVRARIDQSEFERKKSCGIGREIAPYVRRIIKSELREKVVWKEVDSYWKNRWLYTKSGAHSQFFEERVFGNKLDLPERPTRREFAENVSECMVARGEPIVDAGLSWKLEHGKTRAIYSCDTGSYFTFDYLLRPIEDKWANREVLLNPGSVREDSMYDELSKGICKLMIDYDDFNSQHTIEAMQTVIEIACEGAPKYVLDWALESFNNMYVHWTDTGGKLHRSKMVGTLPSGHRATSFLNTILNAAYIHMVVGGRPNLAARHTGDDIIMVGPASECERVLRIVTASRLRTNPSKQGIGRSGEFLRVSFTREGGARGYVARAIASLCSGNWVSEGLRTPSMIADSMVSGFYNVAVRAEFQNFGLVGLSSLLRRCPELLGHAINIVCFKTSLNRGVVWSKYPESATNVEYVTKIRRSKNPRVKKALATQDFLEKNVDFEEVKRFGVSLKSLKTLMQDASYKASEEIEGDPVASFGCTELPVLVGSRYWVREPRLSGVSTSALMMWAKTPEQKACLRMLEGKGVFGTQIGCRGPVTNGGTLPWAFLMSMRSSFTVPIAVHTHFPVRK